MLLGIVLLVLELQGHYQVQAAEPIYIEHIEPTVEVAPTEEIIIITATEPSPEYIEELKTEYPDVVEEVPTQVSLGTFTLTAYCNCTKCCGKWAKYHQTALGTRPQKNHTIAVDPNVIPLGTTVVINGNEYVAEDTGSGVDGNHIDIFFESHQEALNFGKQKAEVFRYE